MRRCCREHADGAERWRNLRELANLAASYGPGADALLEFLDNITLIQDQDMLYSETIAAAAAADEAGDAASARQQPQQPATTAAGSSTSGNDANGGRASGGDRGSGGGGVKLMTIHASKGLEFDTVFVVGCEEDLLPHYHSARDAVAADADARAARRGDGAASSIEEREPASIDEERRLLYVAMTRARRQLYMTWARRRLIWGAHKNALRSRFLDEIPGALVTEPPPANRPAVRPAGRW